VVESELFLLFNGLFDEIIIAFLAGIRTEFHFIIDFGMVIHHLLHLGKGMVQFTLFLREGVCEFGYRRLKGSNFRVLMM
jgi:hypothetical protein